MELSLTRYSVTISITFLENWQWNCHSTVTAAQFLRFWKIDNGTVSQPLQCHFRFWQKMENGTVSLPLHRYILNKYDQLQFWSMAVILLCTNICMHHCHLISQLNSLKLSLLLIWFIDNCVQHPLRNSVALSSKNLTGALGTNGKTSTFRQCGRM
jgi:hypothetical protein